MLFRVGYRNFHSLAAVFLSMYVQHNKKKSLYCSQLNVEPLSSAYEVGFSFFSLLQNWQGYTPHTRRNGNEMGYLARLTDDRGFTCQINLTGFFFIENS